MNSIDLERDRRDLRRGAWQILSGSGVRMAARIMLIIFVARLYGVEDFGRLGETVAVVELAAALATFGLNKTLLGVLVSTGDDGEGRMVIEALLIAFGVSAIVAFILWLAWPMIFNPAKLDTRFAILGVPFIALAEIALTATRHRRTVAWDTVVKALVKPWSFLLFALFGYFWIGETTLPSGEALILAYIASLAVSGVVAFSALFYVFGNSFLRLGNGTNVRQILIHMRNSFPIAVNETAVFAFRRIDILILGLVAGPTATGVYYLAQQVGTVVEKIRHLFEPMLAPIIAQSTSMQTIGQHLNRLCLLVFSIQLGILVMVAFAGQPALEWLGSGFAAGLVVVLVILLGELMDGSFGLCELPMVYRHPLWPPRVVLLALGIEVMLVWALASWFGALGAALGFAIAMTVLSLCRVALVRSLYGFRIVDTGYAVALAVGIVAAGVGVIVYAVSRNSLALAPILAVIVFMTLYAGGMVSYFRKRKSADGMVRAAIDSERAHGA